MKNSVFFFLKFLGSEYVTPPKSAYCGEIGRTHNFYCEKFIIGCNMTISPVNLIYGTADDTVYKFSKVVFGVLKIRRHPINKVCLQSWKTFLLLYCLSDN